jgi:hypothetical protein
MRKSDLTKNWWWTQVLANGKHSLFFIRQSCDSWTQVRWVKPSAVPWQKRVSCHTYMFRDVDISSVSAILLLGFGTVPTVWYHWNCSDSVVLLELFRQCGIIGSVLTVWYYWNCSDSVVLLELFRQCGIIGTVPTVWYYCGFLFHDRCRVACIHFLYSSLWNLFQILMKDNIHI